MKPANNPEYKKVIIENIIKEAHEVKTFVLRCEEKIEYKAGQFLTFVFEDEFGEERRSYSFSSSPDLDEPLAITLKRIPNGKYSRPLIDKSKAGDVLVTTGAAGRFVLPDNIEDYQQVIFFAAGIGITPVYSLIKTLLHKYPAIHVALFYSNTSSDKTVFYKKLRSLYEQFPKQLKLEFLFSSSADLTKARLSKWLLPQLLQTHSKCEKTQQLFYTCGPFAYMRMVTISLIEQGYDQSQIKKENFDTHRTVFKLQPPDKSAHQVTLKLNEKTVTLTVQYPQTILQAAKEKNISLPYSCETGRCGSCVMQCTDGKVWMSYNEVLTEKEILAGKVLTCVAYPVYGDVVLEINPRIF